MKSILSLLTAALLLNVSVASSAYADESAKSEDPKAIPKAEAKAEAGAAAATEGGAVTCANGGDKRTIEKKAKEGGGCEVIYTKAGEAKSIADATNDASHCDKTIDKVKTNLTASGFTCE